MRGGSRRLDSRIPMAEYRVVAVADARRATLLGAAMLFVACRQIVGIDDRQPTAADAMVDATPDAPSCWTPTGIPTACQTCLTSSCCSAAAACAADANCKRSFDCLARCDQADAVCAAACVVTMEAKLAELLACRAQACSDGCGLSCGGILGAAFKRDLTSLPKCADCFESKACVEATACAQEPACIQAVACDQYVSLKDYSAKSQCLFPLGVQSDAKTLQSKVATCATECGFGTDWTCLGKSKYVPGSKAGEVPVAIHAVDAVDSLKMVSGVTIKPCFDTACSVPAGTSCTTGTDGFCAMKAILGGPDNSFLGYLLATAPGRLTTIGVLWPPLVGPLAGSAAYTVYSTNMYTAEQIGSVRSILKLADRIPERAIVAVWLADCRWRSAPGLTIEIDPMDDTTTIAYGAGTTTDATGTALVWNAKADSGTITVRAKLGALLVATATAFVQPGAITTLLLGPL
jgi:hypothetical protein